MSKALFTAAITGSIHTPTMSPYLPITPEQIADNAVQAYEAGAALVNMEFIQIGIASTKTKFNCSGSMMRAVPRLINDAGNDILSSCFTGQPPAEQFNTVFRKGASWPVSYEHKTHIIDIALYKERQNGSKVYLDYSRNPEGFSFDLLAPELQERYRKEIRKEIYQPYAGRYKDEGES